MTDPVLDAARRALGVLGLEGVSAVALVGLVSAALWTHRAATVGGVVIHGSSRAARDARLVAVVLVLLLVLGVVHADLARTRELAQAGVEAVRQQLGRWVVW